MAVIDREKDGRNLLRPQRQSVRIAQVLGRWEAGTGPSRCGVPGVLVRARIDTLR